MKVFQIGQNPAWSFLIGWKKCGARFSPSVQLCSEQVFHWLVKLKLPPLGLVFPLRIGRSRRSQRMRCVFFSGACMKKRKHIPNRQHFNPKSIKKQWSKDFPWSFQQELMDLLRRCFFINGLIGLTQANFKVQLVSWSVILSLWV